MIRPGLVRSATMLEEVPGFPLFKFMFDDKVVKPPFACRTLCEIMQENGYQAVIPKSDFCPKSPIRVNWGLFFHETFCFQIIFIKF